MTPQNGLFALLGVTIGLHVLNVVLVRTRWIERPEDVAESLGASRPGSRAGSSGSR